MKIAKPKRKQCINILPVNDLKAHVEDESCHCLPRIEEAKAGHLVIHNSYDGREMFEYDSLAFARKLDN
jgi:hypothetical protein